jgi:dihydrofolate reductase
MGSVLVDISASLDGYVAGPNPDPDAPLGVGGTALHEWAYGLASFRGRHGESGGDTGPDDDVLAEHLDRPGAFLMGRRMFGGGEGPWGEDPWQGWWGDEPPFHKPVFVLTHHAREPLTLGETTFTFVTDGIESALEQARDAAGERDVSISGGADVIQQYLRAGLVDEMQIHVVPLLLGEGTRLFERIESGPVQLEKTRVIDSPGVTHLRYRTRRYRV